MCKCWRMVRKICLKENPWLSTRTRSVSDARKHLIQTKLWVHYLIGISSLDYPLVLPHWECIANWLNIIKPVMCPSNTWKHSIWMNMSVSCFDEFRFICFKYNSDDCFQVCHAIIRRATIILCGKIFSNTSTYYQRTFTSLTAMQLISQQSVWRTKRI